MNIRGITENGIGNNIIHQTHDGLFLAEGLVATDIRLPDFLLRANHFQFIKNLRRGVALVILAYGVFDFSLGGNGDLDTMTTNKANDVDGLDIERIRCRDNEMFVVHAQGNDIALRGHLVWHQTQHTLIDVKIVQAYKRNIKLSGQGDLHAFVIDNATLLQYLAKALALLLLLQAQRSLQCGFI